jgi:hypothetical protein
MDETILSLWNKGFSAEFIRLLMDNGKIEDPTLVLLVDPPSGSLYGFPKPVDPTKPYWEQLVEAGYPEKDIPFALEHSRYIYHRPYPRN